MGVDSSNGLAPPGPHAMIKEEFMQDCLQLDLPPHPDPYGMYPSMPLSPPGERNVCGVPPPHGQALLCCLFCREGLHGVRSERQRDLWGVR